MPKAVCPLRSAMHFGKNISDSRRSARSTKNSKYRILWEVQNAPSGLAAAVQNDFDGDAQNELVTFTFDKNSTDGDDIRIDLLEIEGGAVKVSDSKYLTEILDISDKQQAVTNSIYFSRANSMEIATSSYQAICISAAF